MRGILLAAILFVSPFVAGGPATAAEMSQSTVRAMPVFEVDPAWPKVPAKWKLGDASSIAIDAQDNVWVLHRPRTLKADRGRDGRAADHGVRRRGQLHQGLGRRGQRL